MAIVLNSDCLTYISTPIQNNFQYKKQEPSPISLVRATRIFFKAITVKKRSVVGLIVYKSDSAGSLIT